MKKHYALVVPLVYTGADSQGYTYESDQPLGPGQMVTIPLGPRKVNGIVIEAVTKPQFATKPIAQLLDQPTLPSHLLDLAQWMSDYYAASPSSVWQTLLPRGAQRKRRATEAELPELEIETAPGSLTDEQRRAIELIKSSPQTAVLLAGVTASGKTRIYQELAREVLAEGRSVIILVPEIALTPQLTAQFKAEFADDIILNHSHLTEAQRHQAWTAALTSDRPRIVIGPRSGLFLPLAKLGLIVIDECHETSYKQEQTPRYWAPAVAARLAHLTGVKLVLGSATPGLWEYYLATQKRLGLARLTRRAGRQPAPRTMIVDLRLPTAPTDSRLLSRPLLDRLTETLAAKRQSLLFLNRRGAASSQICTDCGSVALCPNCQLPLTFHSDRLRLVCHFCNYQKPPPAACPVCGHLALRYLGSGTQKVESELARLFPKARLARLDRDSANFEHLSSTYAGLRAGEIDILVGTQMIAKGLDLPAIDTVGIVNADSSLYLPDYTSGERTFQLINQVSGRAGRGDRPGLVVIQSYTPEHPAIVAGANGNYTAFAASELALRRSLGYPPFVFLLKLAYAAKTAAAAESGAVKLRAKLESNSALTVIGPAPAFRELVGGKFIWQLVVKASRRPALVQVARDLPSGWKADLDPVNLL